MTFCRSSQTPSAGRHEPTSLCLLPSWSSRPMPQFRLMQLPSSPTSAEPARGLLRGHTAEMLRLVLDDEDAALVFVYAAALVARAKVPSSVAAALARGRLVAVRKPSGGRPWAGCRRSPAPSRPALSPNSSHGNWTHWQHVLERRRSCIPCGENPGRSSTHCSRA